jgi:hypothetical protein
MGLRDRPRGCRALVSSRIFLTARGPLAEGFFTGLRVLVGAIELSVSMPNTRSKYAQHACRRTSAVIVLINYINKLP